MSEDWIIDTYVLYRAADVDMDATYFLLRVLKVKHSVVFDHERQIDKEYDKCLNKIKSERKPGIDFMDKWIKHIIQKCIVRFSGKLNARHQEKLENIRLDRSDWPFVAVCAQSSQKRLVSEDSDYTQEVQNYLNSEMSINVLSVQDAISKIDSALNT